MTEELAAAKAPLLRRRRTVMLVALLVLVVSGSVWGVMNFSEVEVSSEDRPDTDAPAPVTTVEQTAQSTTTAAMEAQDGSVTFYAAPDGVDGAAGTIDDPIASLEDAMELLEPGDTLLVRGGSYRENVKPTVRAGTPDAPITVEAYPEERPVVEGLLWLEDLSYWNIRGINVTWDDDNSRRDHMVKFTNGEGWEFTDAEVWGARSYAAILVAGSPVDFRLAHLFVHDTYESNDDNQDHLLYLNSGTGGGVVEHNLLVRSDNGRGIKIGGTSKNAEVSNVIIRFNTLYENLGPSNIQLSYDASDNVIERNILMRPGADSPAITSFRLSGENNVIKDNIAWEAAGVIESDVDGLVDGGGNEMIDPQFRSPESDDFRALASAASGYGHLAVGD